MPLASGGKKVASVYADIGADTTKLKAGVTDAKAQVVDLGNFMSKFMLANASVVGLASGAIVAYGKFLSDSVDAAAQAQAVDVRLAAALHATGREAEISAGQIDKSAKSLEHLSAFDDESIKSAYQAIAQFEHVPTSKMEDIAKAAMDMSAAMGGDLVSNANMIGGILETGLVPRSLKFSMVLKNQIQEQVKAGDTAGALANILGALNDRFGGQAAAQLTTYSGKVQKLKNDWEDYLEVQGGGAVRSGGLIDTLDQTIIKGTKAAGVMERYQAVMNNQRHSNNIEDAEKYLAALEATADRTNDNIENIRALRQVSDGALDGVTISAEEAAKALQRMSDENTGFLGLIQNIKGENDNYNQSLEETARRYGANSKQVKALEAAHTQAMRQIVFNIALAKLEQDGFTDAELNTALQLGENMKIFDKATADMAKGIMDGTPAIIDQAESAARLADATEAAKGPARGLTEQMAAFGDTAQASGGKVKHVIDLVKNLDGQTATAYINIVVSGEVPNFKGWAGQTGNRTPTPPGSRPKMKATAEGGFPERGGWTLVGDRPGGGLTPWSELISPWGEVIPADKTKFLVEHGLAGDFMSAAGGITKVGWREATQSYGVGSLVTGINRPGAPTVQQLANRARGIDGGATRGGGSGSSAAIQEQVSAVVTPLQETTMKVAAQSELQGNLIRGATQQQTNATVSGNNILADKLDAIIIGQQRQSQDFAKGMRDAQLLTV